MCRFLTACLWLVYVMQLLLSAPRLKGVIVDLPEVVRTGAGARDRATKAPLGSLLT